MSGPIPVPKLGDRPAPLNIHVRNQMRNMPRAGSLIERAVRSELHRRGLRFRVNFRGVPGTPDIAFTRAKIAVFIDGCFWHACPLHGTMPFNNREWWKAKLLRNQERDREKDAALEALGWLPLHYWEHDDPEEIADEIEWVWRDISSSGR
ncbi:very short patch repair endonuclease [Corynebacterium hylobatis]|uniref:Very short patch repair endonuclease n=1 Tax=Corynebacterium hylobatis TaxID=1859290 RepID=A0A3R9ZKB6_9CORY|nr:very short patch repair endonuclease [Corynebacterium hylobatis]RSZ65433.1 very short patch repair endonuclease [Corynebacterium hylobatis]